MANKNRTVYSVDEDALKRMVAGDTTALEKIKEADEKTVGKMPPCGPEETQENKEVVADKKLSAGEKNPPAYSCEEYRRRFLQTKLTGARRQTYIHDSLYKAFAKVLPVIAPEMSVPTFVNCVLSDHLDRYQDIINMMYNEEANQKAIEWKK